MKHLTRYTHIVLAAVMCITLASCDFLEQRSRAYEGPPVTEWFPQDMTEDEGSGSVTVEIQLIGEQRSSDTQIAFAVDDSATTATADDYNIVTASPVTIPANSSHATVTIELNGSGIPDGDFRRLTLRLEEGDVAPSENLRYFDLNIIGQ